jgi:hypothetical protein
MTLEAKSLDTPDEKRSFEHGDMHVVNIAGATIGRAVFNPGWKWSNDVRPLAGTDSCEAPHTGYVISGRLHVKMDDGAEGEAGPGDAFSSSRRAMTPGSLATSPVCCSTGRAAATTPSPPGSVRHHRAVLDCADPDRLPEFWSAALGYATLGGAGSYFLLVEESGQRPKLLLQRVPEAKAGKNRMHLARRDRGAVLSRRRRRPLRSIVWTGRR